MENLRNKTQEYIINQKNAKDYFDRFTKLNVYSYTKPNDTKLYIGCKSTEVYSLFNGNTSSSKKTASKTDKTEYVNPESIVIDQSSLQYYLILGLQDLYFNYYEPLAEENKTLKDNITMMQTMMINNKKKK